MSIDKNSLGMTADQNSEKMHHFTFLVAAIEGWGSTKFCKSHNF